MAFTLRFLIDTWLKQSTAQGSTLPEDQRQFISSGTVLPLSSFTIVGNHLRAALGKDSQGNQIFFKGRTTWLVYEPAVELLQDGQVVNPGDIVGPGAPIYQLRINIDTFLKLSTAQSSDLPDNQKQFVGAGTVLPLSSYAAEGRFHLRVALGKDEQGNQVFFQGRTTWFVYRPAVDVLRDGQPIPLPLPDTEPVYMLKIMLDTYLKLSTAQSSDLPEDQKQFVSAGTMLPLSSFTPVGNFHVRIALGTDAQGKQVTFKGRNTWFIYRPAIEILRDGQSIPLFPPPSAGEPPVYNIRFNLDTFLKLRAIQSGQLPDAQKQFISAGTVLPLASYFQEGDHVKIALGKDARGNQAFFKGRNTWYAYIPAISVLRNGQPIDLSAPAPSSGQISAKGLRLLKSFEGLVLQAYLDPVGVWTIGYGTTSGVFPGQVITEAEAEALLRRDLRRFEAAVADLVQVPVNSDQFSALVSFTYNVGEGALASSTLLRLLNSGDYLGAADQLLRWNLADGQVLPGLTRRRQAERALFLSEDFTVFL